MLFVIVGGLSALSFVTSKYWVFYAGEKDQKR
jgi:oligogalacturonide transport system permease protein